MGRAWAAGGLLWNVGGKGRTAMNHSQRKGARKLLQIFPVGVPEALKIFVLAVVNMSWLSSLSFYCVKNRNPNVIHISVEKDFEEMDLEWKERERDIRQIIAWNMLGNNFWCRDDVQKGKEMAGLIGRSTFTFFLLFISGRIIMLYWIPLKTISGFFFFLAWHIFRSLVTRISISCLLSFKDV